MTLFVLLKHDGGRVPAFARVLGAGGMFIQTAQPRPVGTSLDLAFHLPGLDARTEVCGRVAWSRRDEDERRPGMGIAFVDLDPATRDHIDRWVGQLIHEPSATRR